MMIVIWVVKGEKTGYMGTLDVLPSVGDPVLWDGSIHYVKRICWTPQNDEQDLIVTVG